MDDDLRALATLLAGPGPAETTVDLGRRRLLAAIRTPRRRRRAVGWLAGGVGVAGVAAAATAAAVVLSTGTTPAVPSGRPPVSGGGSGARQILLDAATSAAAQPFGTYWHFKIQITMTGATGLGETDETWTDHAGRYWAAQAACGTTPAGVVASGPGYGGFYYGAGDLLTYPQISRLPTNPAALTAWFARYTPPATATDEWLADSFVALEWQLPTPPQVRAAAFRALAALPNITSLGPVPGGQALLVKDPRKPDDTEKLVIDPATALIRSDSNSKGTTTIEAANWTNQLPRVVPLGRGCSG